MIKKLFFLSAFAIVVVTSKAQVVPNKDYVTLLPPGSSRDSISSAPSAIDLTNNAVYISGYKQMGGLNTRDYILVKYNLTTGTVIWTATYDFAGFEDRATAITVDAAGFIYLTGQSWGTTTGFDIATLKYNPVNGNLIWSARYNNAPINLNEVGKSITVDPSGNVYVCGAQTTNSLTFSTQFMVVKYNNAGIQQWVYATSGTQTSPATIANSLVWANNKVYITGNLVNTGTNLDIFTTCLNQNTGAPLWNSTFNGTSNAADQSLQIKMNGNNVLICGEIGNTGTNFDYHFAQLNGNNGNTIFSKTYDGGVNGLDIATALVTDASGRFAVVGYSKNGLNYEYHSVCFSNVGTQLWVSKHITNTSLATPPKIAVDPIANHFYVCGSTLNANLDGVLYQITPTGNETWVDTYNGTGNLRDSYIDLAVDNLGRIYVAGANETMTNFFDIADIRYSQTPVYFPPDFNNEPPLRSFGYLENAGQLFNTSNQPMDKIQYYTESGSSLFYLSSSGYNIANQRLDTAQYNRQDSLARVDVTFFHSNPLNRMYHFDNYPDITNFYQTNIPNGITGVRAFKRIMIPNIYPLIDLHYFSNQNGVKYYFVIKPGGDPTTIQHLINGATSTSVSGTGDLVINTLIGKTIFDKSVAYQVTPGLVIVPMPWTADWIPLTPNLYSFNIGAYNNALPLVIQVDQGNPAIIPTTTNNPRWSTYYGKSGYDEADACDSDNNTNMYATGSTQNQLFPATNAFTGALTDGNETFLFKFSKFGEPAWRTIYGGSGVDLGLAVKSYSTFVYFGGIAKDPNPGGTQKTTFPPFNLPGAYFQTPVNGVGEKDYGFIGKFNTGDGSRVWVSLFGDDASPTWTYVRAIDVDASGNVFIAGNARTAGSFPLMTPVTGCTVHAQNITGVSTGFVAKFNSSNALVWSTNFGNDFTIIYDLKIDTQDAIFICGTTQSGNISNFPLRQEFVGDVMNSYAGGLHDAFISKFNSCLQLKWSTLYGGSGEDEADGLALKQVNLGNKGAATPSVSTSAFITGYTQSPNFPYFSNANPNSINDNTLDGCCDGFIAGFSGVNQTIWSTYLGGSADDNGSKMEFAANGNLYVIGGTGSSSFTNVTLLNSYNQVANSGSDDGFVMAFAPGNFSTLWSTFYGGDNLDMGLGISCSQNVIYICGYTNSQNSFPLNADLVNHPTAYLQTTLAYGQDMLRDAFLATIDLNLTPVGVNELHEKLNEFGIYPNPNSGQVFFQLKNNSSDKTKVEVYDLQGKRVYSTTIPNMGEMPVMLDLSFLSNGMYLLRVNTEKENLSAKVIIAR